MNEVEQRLDIDALGHFSLKLDVQENSGITLTESFAMYPPPVVNGFYFSHPDSR